MKGEIKINRDGIINRVLSEIRKEIFEEFKEDIHEDNLLDIINSEFSIIGDAMAMRETVKLNYLGKLEFNEGHKYFHDKASKRTFNKLVFKSFLTD